MSNSTFIPPYPLKTAVLFLVFNRPDTTKQVFEQIRKAKPPRLYIAADGPRENVPGEAERVKEVREYVLNNIDWNCEVKTLFRDKNLGCKYAVSGAITWFFENEEQGIILEDDTVPSLSFFWFCEELLERYKDDLRVWHIGGSNFRLKCNIREDYFFTRFAQVWGWATWRDRWKYYDVELKRYKGIVSESTVRTFFPDLLSFLLRKNTFKDAVLRKVDTWDYQWHFTVFVNNGLCAVPKLNLINNVGLSGHHTTRETINHNLKKFELGSEVKHPQVFCPDVEYEKNFYHGRLKAIAKIKVFAKNYLRKLL